MVSCSELPYQCDGLFLEEAGWRYGEIKIGNGFSFNDPLIYSEIIKWAQERGVKIYFGDVPLLSWSMALKTLEAAAGWRVLRGQLVKEIDQAINQKKEVSRRDFLKWLGKGAIAFWNLSFLSKLGVIFMKDEVPEFLEKAIAAEDRLHPEYPVILLRNAVIAHKLITIGEKEQEKLGRKVKLAAIFGAGHTGLAEFLREGEEVCKNAISLHPQWFLKATIADGNLDYLSLIVGAQFNPQYNLWIVSERFFDEGLYNLVNQEKEYSSLGKEKRN